MITKGYLTEDGEEYAKEPLCPICHFEWDHWMDCNHPGCHDGRLPKPRTTQRWTQDDLNALLEIVDSLANVVVRLSSPYRTYRPEQVAAESVAQRAQALYRKMVGDR